MSWYLSADNRRLQGAAFQKYKPGSHSSAVSNVRVSDFISDHALVLGQLNFTNPSVPRSKTVTFRRFHKINMDSLWSELANC